MARWVDLDNPQIIKEGRDKFGNVLYAIPPDTQTADVRPVKRGEWKKKRTPYDDHIFICTACLKQISVLGNPLAFCPNCGADMRGGDADGETKD